MIGSMKDRVRFKVPNITPNGQGGFKIDKANPLDLGEFWANVIVRTDQDVIKYGGRQLEANIEIEMRVNQAISTKGVAVWNFKELEILDIVPHKKPGYIRVFAKELVKNANSQLI